VRHLAAGLLQRHVGERPQHRPRLRQVVSALAAVRLDHARRRLGRLGRRAGQHIGEPPVHDLDLAEGAHQDVARLEVAVDDPLAVRVRHRLARLLKDAQQARQVVARSAAPGQ
jgi:hypothetical protein